MIIPYFVRNFPFRYRLFKETLTRELYPNDRELKTKSQLEVRHRNAYFLNVTSRDVVPKKIFKNIKTIKSKFIINLFFLSLYVNIRTF
jgi:hypothetical protein